VSAGNLNISVIGKIYMEKMVLLKDLKF